MISLISSYTLSQQEENLKLKTWSSFNSLLWNSTDSVDENLNIQLNNEIQIFTEEKLIESKSYQNLLSHTWKNRKSRQIGGVVDDMIKEINKSKSGKQGMIGNKSINNITMKSEIHTTAKSHKKRRSISKEPTEQIVSMSK